MIKFINGQAVNKLITLRRVNLNGNICIASNYEGASSMNKLITDLEANCRFDEEPMKKIMKMEIQMNQQMRISNEIIRNLETKMSKASELMEKLEKKEKEMESMRDEIRLLREKINILERMEEDF